MRHKTTALSAAILLLGLWQSNSSAQPIHKQPYAYGHSIDILYGTNQVPFDLDRAVEPTTGYASGGKFDIRYTTFILPWVGLYAQVGLNNATETESGYFYALNKADGGQYQYQTYKLHGYKDKNDNFIINRTYPHIDLGLTFRYDFGPISVRPRIGFGSATYTSNQFAYKRVPRDNDDEAPTIYYYSMYKDAKDYIIGSEEKETKTLKGKFFTGSAQVSYTFNKHFYLSVEGGLRYSPTKMKIREEVYTAISNYDPDSWAEAIYSYDKKGTWHWNMKEYEETIRTQKIGWSTYLQLGIGWNIGIDHTGRGYLRKGEWNSGFNHHRMDWFNKKRIR